MTPAKLEELAREAGAIRLIDAADPKRKTPWSLTDATLAKFVGLVRAAVLEEAAQALESEASRKGIMYSKPAAIAASVRALAQQAGGEQASRGTIPADRRHDAGG